MMNRAKFFTMLLLLIPGILCAQNQLRLDVYGELYKLDSASNTNVPLAGKKVYLVKLDAQKKVVSQTEPVVTDRTGRYAFYNFADKANIDQYYIVIDDPSSLQRTNVKVTDQLIVQGGTSPVVRLRSLVLNLR